MSNHSTALVPVDAWAYMSLDLAMSGRAVDVGLVAESLLYYDQILLSITTQPQFAALLSWFKHQNELETLVSLLRDGTIRIHEYSFLPAPAQKAGDDTFFLINVQDEEQLKPNSFDRRFVQHAEVAKVLTTSERDALSAALEGKVIEEKADGFGEAIEEARRDFTSPQRSALVVQAFVDELYRIRKLGQPPAIRATVLSEGTKNRVTVNIDFRQLEEMVGPKLRWHRGTPIAAAAANNRLLTSASRRRCDLYLGRPLSALAGDKLYEGAKAFQKPGEIIESLKAAVEFPDVRSLVNNGRLDIRAILNLRAHSTRFRRWLQSEADRDRDALIAYHHEVANKIGWRDPALHAISLFGFIGAGTVGGALGALWAGPTGGALGGALGGTAAYLIDIGTRMATAEWRPVVFGEWLRERIARLDEGNGQSE